MLRTCANDALVESGGALSCSRGQPEVVAPALVHEPEPARTLY